MAKNWQNREKKQEDRVCEKIFRVVTSPVRSVRRISKPSSNRDGTEKKHTADPVHVKLSETRSEMGKSMSKIKMETSGNSGSANKKTVISRVETTVKTDERFADYIKRAKLKIRAMTNLGDMMKNDVGDWDNSETETHHHHHHHDHHVPISHVSRETSGSGSGSGIPDQFSEYIKKTKMKLRSSSTIARGNPTYDSFKD